MNTCSRKSYTIFYVIVSIVGIGCIVALINEIRHGIKVAEQRQAWADEAVPFPETSVIVNSKARITPLGSKKSGVTTIEFCNPLTAQNAYVRFVSSESCDVVAEAFIRSSTMVKVTLPYGWYEIRCAGGHDRWYGPEKLFGLETEFMKSRVHVSVGGDGIVWCKRILYMSV